VPSITLMPPPAFDKSLVPAFSTNFNRLRNALARTTNTYVHNVGGLAPAGGFPLNVVVAVPFKADILSVWGGTCYVSSVVAGAGLWCQMDGATIGHSLDQFWNMPNVHMYLEASNIQRGVSAGNHTFSLVPNGSISDGNDRWRIAFTMIEVV
jgi:hypothetical protein